jgi:photosystem II stability/assembly factor-like uncharacterized protein
MALAAVVAGGGLAAAQAVSGGAGPAARQDTWRVIGMGGGGTMTFPTVSPHDAGVVVEACDMTGAYITTDGAKSYRMFNLRTVVRCYAFDPGKANVIYAGNDGVWRSEDTGKTWSLVMPDPAKDTFEHMRGDHADHTFTSDDPAYPAEAEPSITAIAVDPRDSKVIYAAFDGGYFRAGKPALVVSRDYGGTWQKVREIETDGVMQIDVDGKSGVVTCMTPQGAGLLSGAKWEEHAAPKGVEFGYASIARTTQGRPIIYATAEASWKGKTLAGGVYVSLDGGKTWKESAGGIGELVSNAGKGGPPQIHAIAASAKHGETAYVGFRGLVPGGDGACNGIAKTTDGGATWGIVKKEGKGPSGNAIPTWVEPRMREATGDVWFDAPRDLAAAPTDANVCYATDLFRTYRTTDGGKTWETVNSVEVGEDTWTTRGLDVTTCYGVHFDPFDKKRVYISYTDMGMFRSEDGGKSWTSSIEGIPTEWRNTTYWLEFDPEVTGLVWGAFSGPHDLPRPKMWRDRDPGRYTGGVATSTDGGRTWTPTDAGMNQSSITHIIMDPATKAGKRTLYACGFGKGVFKSTDNGKTWALKNNGIEKRQPFAWRLTRANDGTLYLVVARRSWQGEIGDENDGALYRSTDGAEHWEKMALPEGTNGPNGLTLDPSDEKRMYLSAWGKMNRGAADTGGGIFVSEDAGKTWKNAMKDDQHIYDVTADARNGYLYACGFESAAYRSTDKGATWTRLKGYNFKWGHRVIPDPADEKMVYITTFGGSVWYGPAAGDAKAVEDIVTPIAKRP